MASKVLKILVAATLGAVFTHGSSFAHNLSFCIDTASPTAEADRAIAAAVAKTENAELSVRTFNSSDDDDGYGVKDFRELLARGCSLVLGFPVEAASPPLPKDLAFTPPYAATGFVLVSAKDLKATSLRDLPDGTEVAVTSGTIANFIIADEPRLRPNLLPSERDTLKTVESGEDKAALLWRPIVNAKALERFDVSPLSASHTKWKLTALYSTANAGEVKTFQLALNNLRDSGELAKILVPYGMSAGVEASSPTPTAKVVDSSAAAASDVPRLYTTAQATSGEAKFLQNCSQCHGADLTGISGPALVGPTFASEKADFSVGNIFLIVSQNMPATNPGSLAHDDYVQIMSFLLKKNGYPAGAKDLTYDGATKSSVPFVYRKN